MLRERLRLLRKNANLTMKEFGKIFGLAESTISGYENGHREPDYETLEKFANFFGVTVDYLLGRDNSTYVVDKEKLVKFIDSINRNRVDIKDPTRLKSGKYKTKDPYIPKSEISDQYIINLVQDYMAGELVSIPVLGSIRAGQPVEMVREASEETELVERELIHNHDAFILRVQGDSMNGDQIYEGDRVVVIYTPDFSPSDICVVAVNGHEATLKRVKCQGDVCILSPSNPDMEPMVYPAKDVHVIGVVVEVRRRLKR